MSCGTTAGIIATGATTVIGITVTGGTTTAGTIVTGATITATGEIWFHSIA